MMFLEPKALLRDEAARSRIPGEPGDDKRAVEDDRRAARRPHAVEAAVARAAAATVPIGKAKRRPRGHATSRWSATAARCRCALQAAEALEGEGIDAEVIDLRSLWPYDWEAITASVKKTGRVLFVNEDTEVTNFGEHLMRRTVEELFYELLAPPRLLAGKFVPGIGLADPLEMASVPQLPDVTEAMRALAREQP